jgi:hypothetical protein
VLKDRKIATERGRVEIVAGKGPESISMILDSVVIKIGQGDYERKLSRLFELEEEIKKMVKACESTRDRAILMMLYDGGFRIGELGKLTWGQVSFDTYGAVVNVDEKTGKPRYVRLLAAGGRRSPAGSAANLIVPAGNGATVIHVGDGKDVVAMPGEAMVPRSNMPSYRWWKDAKVDAVATQRHMEALGLPFLSGFPLWIKP